MKVLDEKGKLFGLINIIDLLVIFVVLVLIAGGIWYVTKDDPAEVVGPTKAHFIKIKCAGVDEGVADYIDVGANLYYGKGFTEETITAVEVVPAKIDVIEDDGTIVVAEHPELKDIYVTVKIFEKPNDPMLWIGQLHATVGKELVLKTQYIELPGVITEITE